jgi:hypothetical protein
LNTTVFWYYAEKSGSAYVPKMELRSDFGKC